VTTASNQEHRYERITPPRLTLTPSKLRDYLICPLAYKLKIGARCNAQGESPSLAFGNSLHRALEEVYKPSSAIQPTQADAVLRRCWEANGYADEREAATYFERGARALRRYIETNINEVGETLGTELYLSRFVQINGTPVRLGCKIDRLKHLPNGVLEALDYKTTLSGRVPTEEWFAADLPTFIYYTLVRFAYPDCPQVVVSQLNLLTLAKVTVAYQEEDIEANKQALRRVVSEMAAGNFEPRPSADCAWCSVKEQFPLLGGEADLNDLT